MLNKIKFLFFFFFGLTKSCFGNKWLQNCKGSFFTQFGLATSFDDVFFVLGNRRVEHPLSVILLIIIVERKEAKWTNLFNLLPGKYTYHFHISLAKIGHMASPEFSRIGIKSIQVKKTKGETPRTFGEQLCKLSHCLSLFSNIFT